jgi:hypothetical protein
MRWFVADRDVGDRERSDWEVLKGDALQALVILLAIGFGLLLANVFGTVLADWKPEALATLITGGAAVMGAVWVGHRQVDIQKRQLELESSIFNAQMFEDRYKLVKRLSELSLTDVDSANSLMDKIRKMQVFYKELHHIIEDSIFHFNDEIVKDVKSLKEIYGRIFKENRKPPESSKEAEVYMQTGMFDDAGRILEFLNKKENTIRKMKQYMKYNKV